MQSPPTPFSRMLDSEFKRVARQEGKTMEELVDEVAGLVNLRSRQVYNWRSGKWSVPDRAIPVLCRRFGSLALVNALVAECTDVQVDLTEGFDLINLTSQTIRADLNHYEDFLKAYESDGIQPHELAQLRESGDQVVGNVHMFYEIARADCERRLAARRENGAHQNTLLTRGTGAENK